MNKQDPGIEWTHPEGRDGYTWNVSPGCFHQCGWWPRTIINRYGEEEIIPTTTCYAKQFAKRIAAYEPGFEHHYEFRQRLNEPHRKHGVAIFIDSMGDLMGVWHSDTHIKEVLNVCEETPDNIYFILTKNHERILSFEYPQNVWIGVSAVPDFMHGYELTLVEKRDYTYSALTTLGVLQRRGNITFMSFEPLSWDIAPLIRTHFALSWAIIGAGSNGVEKIQPNPNHIKNLLSVLDFQNIPVFMKRNLNWEPHREEFPVQEEA